MLGFCLVIPLALSRWRAMIPPDRAGGERCRLLRAVFHGDPGIVPPSTPPMSPGDDTSPPIDWQDGQPVSRRFGDVYFSRDSGLDETRHVFLEGNALPERWVALPPRGRFTLGETGFGTGLNFAAAWRLWEEVAPAGARLRYVSVEREPLAAADIARTLAMWPELARYRDALLAQWSDLPPGWHRFVFAGGRVVFTLLVGDVRAALPRLDGRVDAWFLDGFAPAKNPEMWQPEVLA